MIMIGVVTENASTRPRTMTNNVTRIKPIVKMKKKCLNLFKNV